jgi:sulfite reductase alpha subunit-like flavoprotein
MAVTQFTTKFNRKINGICSTWLANTAEHDVVPVWHKKGSMVLPQNSSIPLIMVGPGTGVAAFVSFVEHFSVPGGPQLVLIYGSRDQDKDFYYKDKWETFPNLKVITAFSRTQSRPDGGKYYVQHAIRDNKQFLKDLIVNQNAFIYVSGRAKNMPKSVEKAFVEVCEDE